METYFAVRARHFATKFKPSGLFQRPKISLVTDEEVYIYKPAADLLEIPDGILPVGTIVDIFIERHPLVGTLIVESHAVTKQGLIYVLNFKICCGDSVAKYSTDDLDGLKKQGWTVVHSLGGIK